MEQKKINKIAGVALVFGLIAISINGINGTNSAVGNSTIYYPSNVTVIKGTTIGILSALFEVDNSYYYLDDVVSTPGIDIRINFINVSSFNSIDSLAYYSGPTTHHYIYQLKRCIDSTWDVRDAHDTGDSFVSSMIPITNSTPYVCNGTVTVRLLQPQAGVGAHYINISQLVLSDNRAVLNYSNYNNTYNDNTIYYNNNTYNKTEINNSMNLKVNKSGDTINGSIIIKNGSIQTASVQAYVPRDSYVPHTINYTYDSIGGLQFINMAAWNINLLSINNGVTFNTSCGTGDGYGGIYDYCYAAPLNQSFRGGMAYQFVNDAFSYFAWDANINQSKINIQNETDHTQGHYNRMEFSNDLKINYGNITIAKQSGSGKTIAKIDTAGKIYTNRSAGAGIPYIRPDGIEVCITVSNINLMVVTTGACP